MKNYIRIIILSLFFCTLISSCKKDSTSPVDNTTKKDTTDNTSNFKSSLSASISGDEVGDFSTTDCMFPSISAKKDDIQLYIGVAGSYTYWGRLTFEIRCNGYNGKLGALDNAVGSFQIATYNLSNPEAKVYENGKCNLIITHYSTEYIEGTFDYNSKMYQIDQSVKVYNGKFKIKF